MAILGDNSSGSTHTLGNSDRAYVTSFAMSDAGATINSAGAYFSTATTSGSNAKVLIYSQSGGTPNALVAASTGVAVPANGGLVTFAMSGTIATTGNYYVGVVYSDFQANLATDGGLAGMDTCMANGTLSYASPPSTWPGTDISYSDARANAYIDYSVGGVSKLLFLGVGY